MVIMVIILIQMEMEMVLIMEVIIHLKAMEMLHLSPTVIQMKIIT